MVPVDLYFDNAERHIPHNVAIYVDDAGMSPVWVGDTIIGPASIRYSVPPLPTGTYVFRCDIHPRRMVGTLVAVP